VFQLLTVDLTIRFSTACPIVMASTKISRAQRMSEATDEMARRRAQAKVQVTSDHTMTEAIAEMILRDYLLHSGYTGTLDVMDRERATKRRTAMTEAAQTASGAPKVRDKSADWADADYEKAGYRGADLVKEYCSRQRKSIGAWKKRDAKARRHTTLESLLHTIVAKARIFQHATVSAQGKNGGPSDAAQAAKKKSAAAAAAAQAGLDEAARHHRNSKIPLPQRSLPNIVAATPQRFNPFGRVAAAPTPGGKNARGAHVATLDPDEDEPHGTNVIEMMKASMRHADKTPTEASLLEEKRATGRMLRQLDQEAAAVSFDADASDALTQARFEFNALSADLNHLSDFPIKDRMDILRRGIQTHTSNDQHRREAEAKVVLEQKHSAVIARKELKGAFRHPHTLRPCACCAHPFEACKMITQVPCHTIIAVKRSWDANVAIDARDDALARMYDLKRVCVFCSQFFVSKESDLGGKKKKMEEAEKSRDVFGALMRKAERPKSAELQSIGAPAVKISRRGSVVISGGDMHRMDAMRADMAAAVRSQAVRPRRASTKGATPMFTFP
jgi:hypothetical protein